MTTSFSYQQLVLNQITIPAQLFTTYKSLGMDEREVMLLLQIHRFQSESNTFPTPHEISSVVTMAEKECAEILRRLIQKGFLAIEQKQTDDNMLSEAYSLEPLWEKLFVPDEPEETSSEGTLFVLFEQEFGRPLSPFEIEMVNAWLDMDKIAPALIKAALRESVLMGKLNFKYMDRILRDWQKRGIHTVQEAREHSQSFRKQQKTAADNTDEAQKRDTSFYYNWLEGEE